MAKDLYHETVKEALINDGWTITHDRKMMTYVKDAVGVKLVSYSTVNAQLVEWIR